MEQNCRTGDIPIRVKDIRERSFGRLTVVSFNGTDKHNKATWNCLCSCGNETVVSGALLLRGKTKSCGCWLLEFNFTHRMSKHPAHRSWTKIKSRTNNPKDTAWLYYGGRGIETCEEWEDSFEAFWRDMGPTWEKGLTIDRIDVDGNYCKENCRWATRAMQVHNRRKYGRSSSSVGVVPSANSERWVSAIKLKGIHKYIGTYDTELEAATAYDNCSEEMYGDRPNKTNHKQQTKEI